MNPRSLLLLVACLAISRIATSACDSTWPPPYVSESAKALDRLNRIVIPKFEVANINLRQAFDLVIELARKNDPDGQGITVEYGPDLGPAVFAIPGTYSTREETLRQPDDPVFHITASESQIRLGDLVRHVANLASSKRTVTSNKVLIRSGNADEPLLDDVLPLPAFIFGKDATPERLGFDPEQIAGIRSDLEAYLESFGVKFPPGASSSFDEVNMEIRLRNTEPNLSFCRAALGTIMPKSVAGPEVQKWNEELNPTVLQQAKKLVLPAVNFDEVSLRDALEQINRVTALRTPHNLNAISVLMTSDDLFPDSESPRLNDLAAHKISYHARKVSLLAAARALAREAQGELSVEWTGLIIRPSGSEASVREFDFLLPPNVSESASAAEAFGRKLRSGDSPPGDTPGVRSISIGKPMEFGARSNVLKFTGTRARARQMGEAVANAWQAYYASPLWKRELARQAKLERCLSEN